MPADSSSPLPPTSDSNGVPFGAAQEGSRVPLPPLSPISQPQSPPQSRSRPLVAQPVLQAHPIPQARALPQPKTARTPSSRRRAQRDYLQGRRKFVVSGLASFIFHFALVIVLALLVNERREPSAIILEASANRAVPRTFDKLDVAPAAKPNHVGLAIQSRQLQASAAALVQSPNIGKRGARDRRLATPSIMDPGNLGMSDLLTPVGGDLHGMLDGRDGELKQGLLGDGASEASEQAVARGLRWLAAHQRDDGSWHFNHLQGGSCKYCLNPGNHGSTTAATGLALLPFLGAGHTHKRGEYQDVVRRGLDFLKSRMLVTAAGGDLQDGSNMYAQGIATLAMCEAYALTRDPELMNPCREAIRFIDYAQDKKGGGWRYFPGQLGDTTVTGWMLMALKSGQLTYMPISAGVLPAAQRFLDGVQDDGGACYGYQAPSKQDYTMTAIGLLCRMYAGWPRSQPALERGIRMLSKKGPSQTDLYYDYYATQVMRHYGGPEWVAWNLELREHLIRTQDTTGHQSGSWYFPDKHGDQGGRLYNTAMAVLTLEVYYRYLPIYGYQATGRDYRDR